MPRTLEKMLIARGEVERIYTGATPLYLWRALHSAVKTTNPLYPDFAAREIRPGELRPPDVTVRTFRGVQYVLARIREGTSLFDRAGVPPGKAWSYFEIPAGTEIPGGLVITRDEYNTRFQATHYSISPNRTMTKEQLCGLLDRLALNAAARKRAVGG